MDVRYQLAEAVLSNTNLGGKEKMKKRAIVRFFVLVMVMVLTSMALITPVSAATAMDIRTYQYGNRVQARYADPGVDLVLGKQLKVSSGQYTAVYLTDGDTSATNGWISDRPAGYGEVQTVDIDLGAYYYVETWIVKGMTGPHQGEAQSWYRPNAFHLEYMDENGKWIKIDEARGKAGWYFAYQELPRVIIARYLRIVFTEGDMIDGRVRVSEIAIHSSGYIAQPGDIMTTRSADPDHSATAITRFAAIEADGNPLNGEPCEVTYTSMDKWYTGYKQVTVLRVKDATWNMAQGAANYCESRVGFPYNYNFLNYKTQTKFYCNQLSYWCWRKNGAKAVYLDSSLKIPPITVSDLRRDNDVYNVYERSNGLKSSNIQW